MKTNTSMTSHTWKLALVLVFLAISTAVHAAQELSKRQIAAIKSQIPEAAEVSEYASVGPLRNSAGTYFTVFYETRADRLHNEAESSESYKNISRCAIFNAQDSKLVLLARSGMLVDYSKTGKYFVNCDIVWGNVEIHHSGHSGCSYSNEILKFNLSDGQLILIGYDSVYSGCEPIDESEMIFTESVKSVNFLTNEARLWRKAGKNAVEWSETDRLDRIRTVKDVIKYKEVSVDFELDEPFVFELFDIEAFKAWMSQNKDLCGNIDEHYKYVPCKHK
jgi:hypothetical protein